MLDFTEQTPGVLELNNGTPLTSGGTPGSLATATRWQTVVENYDIQVADTGSRFSNFGAASPVALTLPPPQPGLMYGFYIATLQAMTIVCDDDLTEIIQVGALATTTNGMGSVQGVVIGNYLEIEAINELVWMTRCILGNWLVNTQFLVSSLIGTGSMSVTEILNSPGVPLPMSASGSLQANTTLASAVATSAAFAGAGAMTCISS